MLKQYTYSFVDLLRGENKLMFVNMCNLDRIFFLLFPGDDAAVSGGSFFGL